MTAPEVAGSHEPVIESTTASPVVPTLLVCSLFGSLLHDLPVRGAMVVGQMIKTRRFVYVGETITARLDVAEVQRDRRLLRVATEASTEDGICIEGEIVVSFGGER